MDELEKHITDLPWPISSPELRDRIFADVEQLPVETAPHRRKISLKWAAVFVLAAGLLGYSIRNVPQSSHAPLSAVSSVETGESELVVVLIESGSGSNPFDMTRHGSTILPQDYVLSCNIPEETEDE